MFLINLLYPEMLIVYIDIFFLFFKNCVYPATLNSMTEYSSWPNTQNNMNWTKHLLKSFNVETLINKNISTYLTNMKHVILFANALPCRICLHIQYSKHYYPVSCSLKGKKYRRNTNCNLVTHAYFPELYVCQVSS